MLYNTMHNRWLRLLVAVIGEFIAALGVNLFIVPLGLYSGGTLGACQLIRTVLETYLHLDFGGFDIAGMAGLCIGAAVYHIPCVLDGFISAVSALLAVRICPAVSDYLIASHVSAEPAGHLMLESLGKMPMITAGMRLGEGTGAVAAMPLLDMGLAVFNEMTTFEATNIEAYQPLS